MGVIENNSHLENAGKDQTVQKEILPKEKVHIPECPAHQQEIPAGADTPDAPFEKSGLRLVTDLQHCIKAQQSKAYAGKVKLTNLQAMAKTFSYVQEHGYNTTEDAEGRLAEIRGLASSSRKELKDIEGRLRQVNEQIHYTGQYLANKYGLPPLRTVEHFQNSCYDCGCCHKAHKKFCFRSLSSHTFSSSIFLYRAFACIPPEPVPAPVLRSRGVFSGRVRGMHTLLPGISLGRL